MKIFVPVVFLAACVLARPDIGLTLRNQKFPISSYGVPSASVTNPPFQYSSSYLPPAEPSPTFQTPIVSSPVPFYTTGLPIVTPTFAPLLNNGYQEFGGFPQFASQGFPQYTSQGSSFIDQSSQVISAEPAQVQKHVYFFEAPEEAEDIQAYQLPVAPAKKNVKIIFIKAPTYKVPQYPVVPVQPQNEEKTLVYVLVKKPENAAELVIPTQPPLPPAKPEVYFIKYKTQKEAEDKVTNTLTEHANSGANIIANTGFDTGLTHNLISGDLGGLSYTDSSLLGTSLGYTPSPLLGTSLGYTPSPLLGTNFGYTPGPLLSGLGVTVTGNGLPGSYISSSTEPTFIGSTEPSVLSSSTGFESSTVSPLFSSSTPIPPISFGSIPVHPTYIPPVASGPYYKK